MKTRSKPVSGKGKLATKGKTAPLETDIKSLPDPAEKPQGFARTTKARTNLNRLRTGKEGVRVPQAEIVSREPEEWEKRLVVEDMLLAGVRPASVAHRCAIKWGCDYRDVYDRIIPVVYDEWAREAEANGRETAEARAKKRATFERMILRLHAIAASRTKLVRVVSEDGLRVETREEPDPDHAACARYMKLLLDLNGFRTMTITYEGDAVGGGVASTLTALMVAAAREVRKTELPPLLASVRAGAHPHPERVVEARVVSEQAGFELTRETDPAHAPPGSEPQGAHDSRTLNAGSVQSADVVDS